MTWELRTGGQSSWLDELRAQGIAVKALNDRPALTPFETEVLEGFFLLSPRRQFGGFGGAGAIPMTEIKAFLELRLVEDPEEVEDWVTLLNRLDAIYLKHLAQEQEKSKKQREQKARASVPRGARRL